ncbi:helix-turn-helix transcriptional regulator [Rhodococcus fascians]|nr:helix-turn-helix transcriptional regulator [Rhodococcus fascians]MBY4139220.1 helix-turn-helix transcriptional regulator [Rhodococcus fascians]MBY4217687.1 helix-turn-helix transcriptional regulator [Rhodococcus fascians]MBY4224575.1 helix-turn-helix transcriptional regulator [Rhodococcus fascians]MBY4233725.1 helix-turn-helix transcriptional regulator [Rhodococcus fascians]
MHRPTDAGQIANDVARIAAMPGKPAERAAALLEPLHGVLPFDGAWLALCDEQHRGHRSLVSTGWDRRTAAYLDGPVLADEIEQLGMTRCHTPLRVADFSVPMSKLRFWTECLRPAGLREGLSMCLFAADGRHLGFLGLFTGSPAVPSKSSRDLLAALAPTLAQAIDPLRSATMAAQLMHSATAGVILTRSRGVLTAPGLPGHPALRPDSPALAAARTVLDGPQSSFLLPAPAEPGGYLTATAQDLPNPAPRDASAIVLLSPCPDLHGLTRRELEVLGLLIAGEHNTEAAERLGVTARTVATHIEHILTKHDANTRALAAVRAQRRGLYIPPALLPRNRCACPPGELHPTLR